MAHDQRRARHTYWTVGALCSPPSKKGGIVVSFTSLEFARLRTAEPDMPACFDTVKGWMNSQHWSADVDSLVVTSAVAWRTGALEETDVVTISLIVLNMRRKCFETCMMYASRNEKRDGNKPS